MTLNGHFMLAADYLSKIFWQTREQHEILLRDDKWFATCFDFQLPTGANCLKTDNSSGEKSIKNLI